MKSIVAFLLIGLVVLSSAHGDEAHGSYDGQSGSSGKDTDNHGDGYKGFTSGSSLGTFQVEANGTVQEFQLPQSNHRFVLSVLLDGTTGSTLKVSPVNELGDLDNRLKGGKFPSFSSNGFSKAYDFSFDGNVTVNSVNFTLVFPNTESKLAEVYLSKLNLYFVSASNQFFGQVQQTVTSDDVDTFFTFQLLPAKRAVYFFALYNTTDPIPVLYDTVRSHRGGELVKLAFSAGLGLSFKNQKNCSSEVAFRDDDDHVLPRNHTSLGRFFDVEVTNQDGLEATLSFSFNASALAARGISFNRLRWAVLHENGTWIVQGGTISGTVLVHTTDHFSSWGVFAGPEPTAINADDGTSTQAKPKSSSGSILVSVFTLSFLLSVLLF